MIDLWWGIVERAGTGPIERLLREGRLQGLPSWTVTMKAYMGNFDSLTV